MTKKYKFKTKNEQNEVIYEEINLEDKDFLLITAIDNLTNQLKILNLK